MEALAEVWEISGQAPSSPQGFCGSAEASRFSNLVDMIVKTIDSSFP